MLFAGKGEAGVTSSGGTTGDPPVAGKGSEGASWLAASTRARTRSATPASMLELASLTWGGGAGTVLDLTGARKR